MARLSKLGNQNLLLKLSCHGDLRQPKLLSFMIDMISHEDVSISMHAVKYIGGLFLVDDLIADVLKHDDAFDSLINILYK